MEFQVHTTTAKRWPVLLTFLFIGLRRFPRLPRLRLLAVDGEDLNARLAHIGHS
jgi:hypothetical protein